MEGRKCGSVWGPASLVWFGGQQCWFDLVKYAGSDERGRTGYYAWFGLVIIMFGLVWWAASLAWFGGQQVWFGLVAASLVLFSGQQ